MTDHGLNLAILDPAQNEGYGNWPLPCVRDEEIGDLVRALLGPGAVQPHARHAPVLLAFAERMATLARRDASPEQLRLGLAAAGLAVATGDPREGLLVLPLLWRSADVLGLDPSAEFRAVAHELDDGEHLLDFVAREPEDQTIEAMGYVEVDDDLGFHYERTW